MVAPTSNSFTELFADLTSGGFAYENIRFQAAVDSGVVHYQHGFGRCPAREGRSCTWGDIAENNWSVCSTCSGSISHADGWSTLGSSLNALEISRRVGKAARAFREADKKETLTGILVTDLLDTCYEDRQGLMYTHTFTNVVPKPVRNYRTKNLLEFVTLTEATLSVSSSTMLAASLTLEDYVPGTLLPKMLEDLTEQSSQALVCRTPTSSLEPDLEGLSRRELANWYQLGQTRRNALVSLSSARYFKKKRVVAQIPSFSASQLSIEKQAVSLPTPETIPEEIIEILDVLCRDRGVDTEEALAEAYQSAVLLEKA